MSIFTPEWFVSLATIVLIDMLLAGDNAIVIALVARKLPHHLPKKAVLVSTAGAIIACVVLVFFALTLLRLPGLSLSLADYSSIELHGAYSLKATMSLIPLKPLPLGPLCTLLLSPFLTRKNI